MRLRADGFGCRCAACDRGAEWTCDGWTTADGLRRGGDRASDPSPPQPLRKRPQRRRWGAIRKTFLNRAIQLIQRNDFSKGTTMAQFGKDIKMYAENGLRTVDGWLALSREVE